MATKPTLANAEWATNAVIAGSPVVGQNGLTTKDDPGLATRQAGGVPGRSIRARTLNFLLHQFYLWATFLGDLHNSADFLNKDYDWTGAHTWDAGIEVDGEYSYGSARSYSCLASFTSAYFYGNAVLDTNHVLTSVTAASSDVAVFEPDLPSNATVTAVTAGVNRAVGGAGNMTLKVYKIDIDNTGATGSTQTQLSSTVSSSGTGNQLLLRSGLSEALSPQSKTLKIEVAFSNSGAQDQVFWVRTDFTTQSVRPR